MPEVVPAASSEEVQEVVSFRSATLEPNGFQDEYDRDPTTVHCLVRDRAGQCVGVGRLVAPVDTNDGGILLEGNPVIGPIVVTESARGQGIGRAILTFLEEEALMAYGRNGVVQVEGWVPEVNASGVSTAGYTVKEGAGEAQGAVTRVFRDVKANSWCDAREGDAMA